MDKPFARRLNPICAKADARILVRPFAARHYPIAVYAKMARDSGYILSITPTTIWVLPDILEPVDVTSNLFWTVN